MVVHAVGWVGQPLLLAVALSATSLGLVIPVLKDAGYTERPLGQLVIAAATVADFAAVLLLSVLFSQSEGSTASRIILFARLHRRDRARRDRDVTRRAEHGIRVAPRPAAGHDCRDPRAHRASRS